MKKERFRPGFVHLRLVVVIMVASVAAARTRFNVTRHYQGDVFSVVRGSCPADLCFAHERRAVKVPWAACECQCSRTSPVFRQDLEQCVNTIRECGQHTASFVGPSFSETIPLIFLPRRDGLIYPTAEVSLTDPTFKAVGPNICVLKELKMLGENGWETVEALTNDGPSFKAVGGAGKLFLQFSGNDEMRQKLFGSVVVVSVVCHKDFETNQHLTVPQVVGEYCIAFRVAHLPGLGLVDATPPSRGSDYVIIGLCAGLLGVTYVGAVLIYLLVRWQRRYKGNRKNGATSEENPNGENGRIPGKSVTSNGHVVASSEIGPTTVDPQTAQLSNDAGYESCQPGLERAPFKGLHVETIANGGTAQGASAAETSTQPSSVQRRRLYFDPSFLESDVLHSPPPAALEFLQRLREMISTTTCRIRKNRFLPSLLSIPEENQAVFSSMSVSPRPPARKSSAKGKSTKEGIENEAFNLDEEEEERAVDKMRTTQADNSKNHIYSWIADEDEEDIAIGNDDSDKAAKVGGEEEETAETMPFALNPSAGAVEDEDRFMFLARIPEDGELTDSFDGLYDFESFRQEMVKKMQKKRRNQMKPNDSGPTLDVNGELSDNLSNEEILSEDWADYNDDNNLDSNNTEESKTQPDSLDLLKSSDSNTNTKSSSGSSSFPKVSRIQILQRMFQGENSDNSASDKSDSDSSFDSLPTANEQGKGLVVNEQDLNKTDNVPHNEMKVNALPKASKKPLATYLFGETLLKVAKCQDKDDNSSGFFDKNSDKTAMSSPAPPKIERLKRKSIGNNPVTLDSPVWSKGQSSGSNQSRAKTEESHYNYPVNNTSLESKPCHKQIVMVNGHNGDVELGGSPSQDNMKTPTALANGSLPFENRVNNQTSASVVHNTSNSANPISNESRENIYDVPPSLPSSESPGRPNGLKHFPEDSGYQSSDSDQSSKGMTNRFGNKMKSLRKLLTISPSKSDDPILHNTTNSSYDHNWSSGEGMSSYFLKYGTPLQDNERKAIHSGYTNGNLIPKIVSTLESTMDLGTEDEEEYKGNSSDSEYADSLDGSTAVR